MLKKILLGVVIVVIAVVALALQQPDEFRVSRSAVINASTGAVFAQVNDLEKWQAWSPWEEMDPEATVTLEVPRAGVGAISRWEGEETGKGSMTIEESRPDFIRFRLEFLEPMQSTSAAEFQFVPEGAQTRVTWTMYGPNDLMGKIMGLFMDCEGMIGEQFEKGLENLKRVAEKEGASLQPALSPEVHIGQ